MRSSILSTAAAVTLFGLGVGCGDEAAPSFVAEQGQIPAADMAYPDGATGFDVGDMIPNLQYVGYADYTSVANNGALNVVQMADFYNPTGTEVYPAGSPYGAGKAEPKAVNIITSTVWCPPCNEEAATVLPVEYAAYSPLGGHFMTVLLESLTAGPAMIADVTNWAKQYNVNYTIVNDPTRQTDEISEPAYPTNHIIRTSDMRIICVMAGVAQKTDTTYGGKEFWEAFDQVLAGTYTTSPVVPPQSDLRCWTP